jgi:hypothetical protein
MNLISPTSPFASKKYTYIYFLIHNENSPAIFCTMRFQNFFNISLKSHKILAVGGCTNFQILFNETKCMHYLAVNTKSRDILAKNDTSI